ncbi:MAG TPA: hypothetical protein VG435_09800 [Acidimicrobiales bacterium]|nr:hypothetical protein [Acidimicrobiales bacterium]
MGWDHERHGDPYRENLSRWLGREVTAVEATREGCGGLRVWRLRLADGGVVTLGGLRQLRRDPSVVAGIAARLRLPDPRPSGHAVGRWATRSWQINQAHGAETGRKQQMGSTDPEQTPAVGVVRFVPPDPWRPSEVVSPPLHHEIPPPSGLGAEVDERANRERVLRLVYGDLGAQVAAITDAVAQAVRDRDGNGG